MDTGVPPHPVLGAFVAPLETPVDETVFDVPEAERGLPMTIDVKKNLALRGCVDPSLVYPFVFSSNGLSLGFLFSSVSNTLYSGIGIRYNAEGLSVDENQLGVQAYHYVLDEIEYVNFWNKTVALAGKGLASADNPKTVVRTLTSHALILLVMLKKMQQSDTVKIHLGDFPLTSTRHGLLQFVSGFYEETWAVGYQMAGEDSFAFSSAALVRACAAYYYYLEAFKTDLFKAVLAPVVENAKQRVKTVLIGYIISRIDQSRLATGLGCDIPWTKTAEENKMTPGKYRAIVFAQLGITTRRGRESKPPSPRYADVYKKAVGQCRANLLTSTNGAAIVVSSLDPYIKCRYIGEEWATSKNKDSKLFASATHPQARSANFIWNWQSETLVVPEGLAGLYAEGQKRFLSN